MRDFIKMNEKERHIFHHNSHVVQEIIDSEDDFIYHYASSCAEFIYFYYTFCTPDHKEIMESISVRPGEKLKRDRVMNFFRKRRIEHTAKDFINI